MDGRRKIDLEEELRRIDRELNGPKVPREDPKEDRPKKPAEPPPWTGPLLLD